MAEYKAGNLSVEFFGIDNSLSGTLQDITNRLEKLEKVTKRLGNSGNNDFMKKFNLGFMVGKIKTIYGVLSRTTKVASQILQYGVDYTETLNLWQVAMGNNLSLAQDFVTQMNRAYGISEKTLMNAQAIFKNMLGSLGQISDTMAYNLSEAITKMAIDYSSLYNVPIDAAITKFQAVLAAQVRPIRSVSGYDITENTLYQLYQSIGGTKTMRQLSRTEKQLLSIYAVFQQMGASGALGDMEKTIGEVANQSRMMAENWEQLMTWAGVSLQYILQEYDVFKYINATLIFTTELLKSIAYSLGYETPDFANSWADNVEETEEAVDKLQGKLLDFDKFRSLSSAEENVLGIDTKLMEAISGYTSDIGKATNAARELAETWLTNLGFVDENGDGVYEITEEAKKLLYVIDDIWTVSKDLVIAFKDVAIELAPVAINLLKIINDLNLTKPLIIFLISLNIGKKIDGFGSSILDLTKKITGSKGLNKSLATLKASYDLSTKAQKAFALGLGAIGFSVALFGFNELFKNLTATQKIIAGLIVTLGAAAAAWIAYHTASSFGVAAPIILTAIGAGVAGIKAVFDGIKEYKNGGMPDKGTMFIAGEAGAEMVYNTPSGQSGVANIQQIQQAMYGALVAYGRAQGNGATDNRPIDIYIDGEKVFQATKKNAKRHGLAFSKV